MRVLATEPASVGQLNHAYLPPSPKLSLDGWPCEATLHLPDSRGRNWDADSPSKGRSCKYRGLRSYQGHPYPWTESTINQEATRSLAKVMSTYSTSCPTLDVGR
jgi:hypothetical protein